MAVVDGVTICDACGMTLGDAQGLSIGRRLLCRKCAAAARRPGLEAAASIALGLGTIAAVMGAGICLFEGPHNAPAGLQGLFMSAVCFGFAGVVRLGLILDAIRDQK